MKPKHRTIWSIFIDDQLNTPKQWKTGTELTNGWFTRYTKKSAQRLVNKLYREHGVYFFATIHGETKIERGRRVYKYALYPDEVYNETP